MEVNGASDMMPNKESPLHIKTSREFKDRIKRAMRITGWSTMSDYARQAIREKLERDGV